MLELNVADPGFVARGLQGDRRTDRQTASAGEAPPPPEANVCVHVDLLSTSHFTIIMRIGKQ